jgi:transcriptional regulator with XRE-family HTH domain
LDNALAESTIGLVQDRVDKPRGPWHKMQEVDVATAAWVSWHNNRRLQRGLRRQATWASLRVRRNATEAGAPCDCLVGSATPARPLPVGLGRLGGAEHRAATEQLGDGVGVGGLVVRDPDRVDRKRQLNAEWLCAWPFVIFGVDLRSPLEMGRVIGVTERSLGGARLDRVRGRWPGGPFSEGAWVLMSAARKRDPSAGERARREVGEQVTGSGPVVLRIGLGNELRKRRESAGVTREAAGEVVRVSAAKIGRFELGRDSIRAGDVAELLTLYGVVRAGERAEFLELARQAEAPGWWHRYADMLPSWFETYLGLEQAAAVIRTYVPHRVPTLLQTPAYARAATALDSPRPVQIERQVELRMCRQQLLLAPDAPTLWAVVDEDALRPSIGGPELAREQLAHLLEMSERTSVSLQIAPLGHRGRPAVGGPLTLLRFAHRDLPDIAYLEQLTSALYLDRPADVDHYTLVMDTLVARIEPTTRTAAILSRIRGEI